MEAKICERCGVSFTAAYPVAKAYWARRRFCSTTCSRLAVIPPPRTGTGRPLAERFWEKVNKGSRTQCWLWAGACNPDGYGVIAGGAERSDKWLLRTHRVSWELTNGAIPVGAHVLHRCDNPPCVNPNHLFIGTQVDNNRDRDLKGRGGDRRGMKNGRAKLTDMQVNEIRETYAAGSSTYLRLARQFKCSEAQIARIVLGLQRR